MPIAALSYCAQPGCGVKVAKGYCRAHQVQVEHRRYNWATRRWYYTLRWQATRRAVLRDEPICRKCRIDGRLDLSTEVDHIVPHRGDPALFWDRANLQGLCKSHHDAKTGHGL